MNNFDNEMNTDRYPIRSDHNDRDNDVDDIRTLGRASLENEHERKKKRELQISPGKWSCDVNSYGSCNTSPGKCSCEVNS